MTRKSPRRKAEAGSQRLEMKWPSSEVRVGHWGFLELVGGLLVHSVYFLYYFMNITVLEYWNHNKILALEILRRCGDNAAPPQCSISLSLSSQPSAATQQAFLEGVCFPCAA